MPESVTDFSKRIKLKYPEYADIDDNELAKRVVDKYPEYKDKVDFGTVEAPVATPAVARPTVYTPKPAGIQPPKMAEFTPEQIAKVQEPTAENLTKTVTSKLTPPAGLESGIASMNAAIARTPAVALSALTLPGNLLAKYTGGEQTNVPDILINNPVTRYYEGIAKKTAPPELDTDSFSTLKRGDIDALAKELSAKFFANAPTQAIVIGAAMTGNPGMGLAAMGGISAGGQIKQAAESGVDPAMVAQDVILNGGLEVAGEKYGTLGLLKNWSADLATKFGKKTAYEIMKAVGRTVVSSAKVEGAEEFSTQMAQDFADYATGVNPKALTGMFGRAVNAAMVGGLSGGLMTAPGAVAMGQQMATAGQGGPESGPGAPAGTGAHPRPPFGSFEGTVLEFKIKQAMGLKPADQLTDTAINVAFAAGKIPQDLAEQMGHPGALQAAQAEAAKNAPPAPALAPEEAMIQQVVADKTKTHEALSEPHPVTGQKPYQMSEQQYGAALRELDPNISGEDISKSYEKLLKDAKDVQLVDDRDIELALDPAQQAEALAISEEAPADKEFDLMEPGQDNLSALPLAELQAMFPGASEQLHRELVVEGLNTGQITPEQAPYADIKKAAIERVNQEQLNVEKRQEAAAGTKTPILQMLWKRKLNRGQAQREGIDLGAMRGYFTEKGGLTIEQATENAYEMGWIQEYDQQMFMEAMDKELMRKEGVMRSPEESYKPGFLASPGQEYTPASVPAFYSTGEMPTDLRDLFAMQSGEGGKYSQSAWHGSPHDFDKFLLHKIGTGEGAQAYGWGLYFAGDKAVAEYYKEKLSNPHLPIISYRGDVLSPLDFRYPVADLFTSLSLPEAMDILSDNPEALSFIEIENVTRKDFARKERVTGKLYEVEIPESKKMLDWDKNFDQQPDVIKKGFKKALLDAKAQMKEVEKYLQSLPKIRPLPSGDIEKGMEATVKQGDLTSWILSLNRIMSSGEVEGSQIYHILVRRFGSPEKASKYLNSLGVPGIKYLNGVSRKHGEGDYNYVIFDDNLVQIVNKYSQPVAKYEPGHVYTPGEMLTDEAGAGAELAPAVRDVRSQVRPVGQWHDLRKDPAIAQISKDFIEKQLTSAIGKKIDTIQDVAEIAAMARHPRIEHLVVVKLKKGKVIGSLVLTDGKIGYIDPNMAEIQAFLQDADEFYMSHNHPTGNPAPSVDDIKSTKAMASDIRFKGHVVTDHKTYTAIAPDGTAIAQEYRGEKVSFRTDIEKMSWAPAVMGWVRGTLQGDKLGIMFVDPQKQVMSFDQVDPRSDYNTYITRKAPGYGATGVFLIAGESAMGRMAPRVLAGNYHDFLVINDDGMYRSASLGNVEGFSIDAADSQLAPESEGYFSASRYAETPADYNPEDYNKVLGRFKHGMTLTLRNRLVTPQFPAGLPRGSVFELKSVAKTGEMLVSYKGKIMTVAVTPNMFKETYREPGAPQPGQKERKFINTVRGFEGTAPEVKDTIAGNYDVITNEVTLAEAKAIIAGSMDRAIKLVNETKEPTRLSNTVAMLLIDAMQQQGRFEEAIGLIEHTAERNTGAGQAIQALAMYRRLTPEGILRFADGVVRKAQDAFGGLVNELRGLADDKARAEFAKKHGIPYMSAQQASELYDAAVEVAKMEPGRARDLATGKMLLKVSQLVPKTFWEKVSSLQILAQLLNPKTFVRNLLGNAAFMAFENFSQATGVPLDMLVGAVTGKRTIGMPGFMTQASGFLKGAKEGTEEALAGVDLKQINNKFDLPRGSAFDSRAMRALEALLNISLKATDRAFYQAAFSDSLRVAMKQSKVTAPTPEMVSQAHLDGLYRTFNDDNALRTALVHVKRSFNLNQKWGLGDMVIKYPGTPASILMRGIEYSPFGFMQAVYTLAKAGSVANFDQRAFVQQTTRALTGSMMLVGTGMILSALGLIRGKDDDKRSIRETEASIGVRDYQINLSGLIRFAESGMDPAVAKMRKGDQLVSYDWLQPMAINLAMGANIQRGVETSGSAMIADALQSASMTLEEQPLLAGISRFFSGRSLTKGVEATIKAIPASFMPTLVNQFRQLIDNVSRNTQSDSYLDAMGNQVKMKVPGLSGDLPPRVDVLGRVRKTYQNDTNNPFNVFLNPAFVNRYEPTPTTELVLDIWARSGETIQLPRIAPRQIKVRGVTRPLTKMEQAQFQHYIGERTALAFSGFARNPDFLAAPDHVKAKHLQGILTDMYQSARVNVLGVPPR